MPTIEELRKTRIEKLHPFYIFFKSWVRENYK